MTPTRCFDFIFLQKEKYPLDVCMSRKVGGNWNSLSTKEVIEKSEALASGLIKRGIRAGDKIAIISENRPEWLIADLAIQQIGAISVPLYPNSVWSDYKYIFNHAEVKMVFFSNTEIGNKVLAALNGNDSIHSFSFDNASAHLSFDDLFENEINPDLEKLRLAVKPEEMFTIIYTSGTTGKPKGVMLSHNNVVSNSIAVGKRIGRVLELGNTRILSFLPLCHIFERTASFFYMSIGASIYYAESLDKIADNLKEVKPDFFATVPRLLEKVYDKIEAKGNELTGIKRQLFFWALSLGLKYEPNVKHGFWYDLQLSLANKIIFSKWREALGGNIKFIASGAAALQPKLAKVFWAAKIKILEAYGLTETSPGITVSLDTKEDMRIGCVGTALDGIEIKIDQDGEVLCKGPNVMMGYYKDTEATNEVIKDGWLHTGDIGEIREGKYLKITDRKKEIFKTSGGKYIAPQPIENKLKESVLVDNAIIVGENEKFPSALIVPNFEEMEKWAHSKHIKTSDINELTKNEYVIQKYGLIVEKVNYELGQWESIKEFRILPEVWTIEGEELTPTLKLKRRIILEKHKQLINSIYK